MNTWRRWLLVAAVVAAGAVVTTGRDGQDAVAAPGATDALSQSAALAAAPDLPATEPAELDGAQAAAAADSIAARIPLPAGGKLNGIRWAELDGTIDAPDAQAIVEYNAACQWYRALRDGRQAGEARRIVAEIPRWPATRSRATGELATAVAADVEAGGGEALAGVLRDCDAAHRRELAFAAGGGRTAGR